MDHEAEDEYMECAEDDDAPIRSSLIVNASDAALEPERHATHPETVYANLE